MALLGKIFTVTVTKRSCTCYLILVSQHGLIAFAYHSYSNCGVTTTKFLLFSFSYTKDFWVFYGINTELFQCGSELKAKNPIAIPWKFSAKINVREKKFELDFSPCKKEFDIFSVRYVLGA